MMNTMSSFPRRREPSKTISPRSGQHFDVDSLREHAFKNWIPACAGMTQEVPAHSSSQRGFSLVSAIFLLVVIAALGTFAVTLSTTQQQSSALDVLGSRAYQASRAGIEWGAYQIIQSGVVGGAFAGACQPGPTSSQVALTNTLAGFYVNVLCSSVAASEAGATVTMYRITSTASGVAGATVGSPSYVERQMQVTIAQP